MRNNNNTTEGVYSVEITCTENSTYGLARFVNALADMMQKYQAELLADPSNTEQYGEA